MRSSFVVSPLAGAALAAVALFGAGVARAEVHKCVDAADRISFQDHACPEGSQDTVVKIVAPSASSAPAPNSEGSGEVDPNAPPPPVRARPPAQPGSGVPQMYVCTRPEDNSQYMSRDGATTPRMVPAGVLGVTNKSLNDAYSGPNGVGVSAPGVRPTPIDRSAAGSVATGYVAVQDSCTLATREQVCEYLQKKFDANREKLRRAFKDERAVLEPQQDELEQQLDGC